MLAIVAAGGVPGEKLRARGVTRIPLLTIGGETLLSRICHCLLTGGGSQSVVVLAPEDVPLPAQPAVSRGKYTGHIVDDVIECAAAADATAILIASADMPLITPEAISALVEFGRQRQADVLYPVVDQEVIEARFPGTKRTYLKLRELTVSGGNVFWVNRNWLVGNAPLLRKLFDNRKNLLGLMGMFGLWFFLRLITRQADLPYLEQHLGRVVNAKVHAVRLPYAELAVDLDKESDLDLFTKYLDPLPNS